MILFRKLMRGPLFFAATNVGAAAFGFALVPLLSRSLDSISFAIWAVCESAWLLSGQLLQLGLGNGAIMQVSSGKHPWQQVYLAHTHMLKWVVLVGGACAALIAWFLGQPGIALAIALNVAMEGAVTYQTYAARSAGLQGLYAALTAGRALLVVCAVGLVSLIGPADSALRLEWMLLARALCCAAIVAPCHVYCMRGSSRAEIDRRLVADAIRFGVPMALSGVLLFAQEGLVRSGLASFISAEAVEQYYVHAKCVSIAGTFIVAPVGLWWGPQRFRLASQGGGVLESGARVALRRSLLIYALLLGGMAVGLPEIIAVFGPRVRPDLTMIALLAVPPASQLIATLTNAGLMQPGQTHSLAWVQFGGLVLLSAGIVPAAMLFGVVGVCAAAAASAVVVAFVTAQASIKRLPLNYQLVPSISVAILVMAATLSFAGMLR
jgi:O-antigen/teichoic acid export membrane protein